MKKLHWESLLLLCVLVFLPRNSYGQQQQQQLQQQQRSPLLVAVIDVQSVLQNHPAITDEIPILQQQFQKEVAKASQIEQNCQKNVEKLQTEYKIGSPEYENALRPIRDQLRNLEVELQEKQTGYLNQISKIRYKVFMDVQSAIQEVAVQSGILVVHLKLKMDRTNVSEEVATLQEADNNVVVWNHPKCDITEMVKNQLAQNVGTPKTKAGGPLENMAGNIRPSGPQQNLQTFGNNLNNGANNGRPAMASQPNANNRMQ
ncbi:MAG: OmpH family outer membrane protein [Planctomycetia bacterium]|nr:OmpH family outer membrane protein [Planctomycetia bacterium]